MRQMKRNIENRAAVSHDFNDVICNTASLDSANSYSSIDVDHSAVKR